MSFLTNNNVTQAAYLSSLHLASQNYVIKTVATADTLANTNIGLESDRAQGVESSIEQQLTTYMASSDTNTTGLSASIAAIQAKAVVDEGLSAAEVTRAQSAEAANKALITGTQSALTAENARALAAESVLASGISANGVLIQAIQVVDAIQTSSISSNSTQITALQASRTTDEAAIASHLLSITSLQTSRTADETSIASLVASRTSDESNIASNTTSISLLQAFRVADETAIASNKSSIASLQSTQSTDETHIASLQAAMNQLGVAVNTSSASVSGVLIAGSVNTNTIGCAGPLTLTSTNDKYGRVELHIDNTDDSNGLKVDTTASNVDIADIVLQRNNGTVLLRYDGSTIDSNNTSGGEFKMYNRTAGVNASGSGLTLYSGVASSGIYQGDFNVKSGSVIASKSVNVPLIESDNGALTLTATHSTYGPTSLLLTNIGGNNGLTVDNSQSTADIATFEMKTQTGLLKTVYEKRAENMNDSNNAADGEYRIEGMHGLNFYSGTASTAVTQGNFAVKQGSITANAIVAPSLESDSGSLSLSAHHGTYGTTSLKLGVNDISPTETLGLILDNSQTNLGMNWFQMKVLNGDTSIVYDHTIDSTRQGTGNGPDGELTFRGSGPDYPKNFFIGSATTGLSRGNFQVQQGSVTANAVIAPSLSYPGPLTLTSTGDQYGQVNLRINNTAGANGVEVDTTGATVDVADVTLCRNTGKCIVRFDSRTVDSTNSAGGEFKLINQATGSDITTLYSGAANSGLVTGNFNVKAGIVTDINDLDYTLGSYWSNAFNNVPAEIRLVRKGNIVTVVMQNFSATAIKNTGIAQYNLSVPSVFIPVNGPVQCSIVVATNGNPSVGCATMTSTGLFQIFPFSGNWGTGSAGINQPTSFSYLL